MGVSPLLGDRRGTHQAWVYARIDLGRRVNQLFLLILVNDWSRDCLAVTVFKDELRFKIEAFRLGGRGRGSDCGDGNNGEQESNFSHGSAPYALDREPAQTIFWIFFHRKSK